MTNVKFKNTIRKSLVKDESRNIIVTMFDSIIIAIIAKDGSITKETYFLILNFTFSLA